MSSHSHELKITLSVKNVEDTEAHQEITLIQRCESSEDLIKMQQGVTESIKGFFFAAGNEALEEKQKGKSQSTSKRSSTR